MKEPEFSNPKKYSGVSTRWLAWNQKQKEMENKPKLRKIRTAYNQINKYVGSKKNKPQLREEVKALLEIKLRDIAKKIICDETNNPPDVVDSNYLTARVYYIEEGSFVETYVELDFGKDVEIYWKL